MSTKGCGILAKFAAGSLLHARPEVVKTKTGFCTYETNQPPLKLFKVTTYSKYLVK
jgi:hypothetical protein